LYKYFEAYKSDVPAYCERYCYCTATAAAIAATTTTAAADSRVVYVNLCVQTKWDAVNKQYQLMAHVVDLDSFGKRRRKVDLITLTIVLQFAALYWHRL
jgi:hypothetical protein